MLPRPLLNSSVVPVTSGSCLFPWLLIMAGWPLEEPSGQATHRKIRKAGQSRALNYPNGNTMKFENISEAELDARRKALQEKYQQKKRR